MSKNVILHDSCLELPKYMTGDRKIDCIVTDPPFGVDVKMNSAESPEQKAVNERIHNDGDLGTALDLFCDMIEVTMPLVADTADLYFFTSWHYLGEWLFYIDLLGSQHNFTRCGVGIWDKGYPGKGDLEGRWGMGFEFIIYCKRGRRKLNGKRRNLILAVDKVASGQNIHPTEKPVALMEALIEASTDPGDLVYDPFSGSGVTAVAAQRCGRDSLGFETDERFIAPSRARLEQMTGFGV